MNELITERVRRIAADDPNLTDTELTQKVAADLTSEEHTQVFMSLLRVAVRDSLSSLLRQTQTDTSAAGHGRRDTHSPGAGVRGVRKNFSSLPIDRWKFALRCEVSPDGLIRKQLRDCNRDDLLGVVAQYEQRAAQNVAQAERYRKLADLLVEDDTVGHLDPERALAVWQTGGRP